MGHEIARQRVLGNFKRGPSGARKQGRRRRRRDGQSATHLAALRRLPCAVCLGPSGTVHHLKLGTGERGMGMRATDKWGVPMCPKCHAEVELIGSRNEHSWFARRGVDPMKLAFDLWTATPDRDLMETIVRKHHVRVQHETAKVPSTGGGG